MYRFGRSVSLKTNNTRRISQYRILIQLVQSHEMSSSDTKGSAHLCRFETPLM